MRSINASHLDVAIAAELRALTDARYADLESPKQISKKKPPPEVRKPPSEVQKPKPKPKPKMSEPTTTLPPGSVVLSAAEIEAVDHLLSWYESHPMPKETR
jgi:hypothetical protein